VVGSEANPQKKLTKEVKIGIPEKALENTEGSERKKAGEIENGRQKKTRYKRLHIRVERGPKVKGSSGRWSSS
jgi:hypothetical protein